MCTVMSIFTCVGVQGPQSCVSFPNFRSKLSVKGRLDVIWIFIFIHFRLHQHTICICFGDASPTAEHFHFPPFQFLPLETATCVHLWKTFSERAAHSVQVSRVVAVKRPMAGAMALTSGSVWPLNISSPITY
jgi:hypothetical protein